MIGPEVTHEMVECGPNIEPLKPTPYLRISGVGELLEQWHEATCTVGGVTHTKGTWRPVPRRY
jgi:hypothetical protein